MATKIDSTLHPELGAKHVTRRSVLKTAALGSAGLSFYLVARGSGLALMSAARAQTPVLMVPVGRNCDRRDRQYGAGEHIGNREALDVCAVAAGHAEGRGPEWDAQHQRETRL